MIFQCKLTKLKLNASIGIHDFEKCNRQEILLDVKIKYKLHDEFSDNIEQTLDYDLLRNAVIELVASQHFNLQETLAVKVADIIKQLYPKQMGYTIFVRKTTVYPDCESVGVVLEG